MACQRILLSKISFGDTVIVFNKEYEALIVIFSLSMAQLKTFLFEKSLNKKASPYDEALKKIL